MVVFGVEFLTLAYMEAYGYRWSTSYRTSLFGNGDEYADQEKMARKPW